VTEIFGNSIDYPILTLVTFLPLAGAVILLFMKSLQVLQLLPAAARGKLSSANQFIPLTISLKEFLLPPKKKTLSPRS